MKRLGVVCAFLLVFVAGCAGTSMLQEYATAREGYNIAVSAVVDLRRQGKIDDAAYNKLTPVITQGAAALNSMRDAALLENRTEFSRWGQVLVDVTDNLLTTYQQGQR